MVVLTNEEELKKKIRSDLTKEFIFDEKKVEERFNEIIAKKQEDLKALPARSYVNVGSGKFPFNVYGWVPGWKQIAKYASPQLSTPSRIFSRRLIETSKIRPFN